MEIKMTDFKVQRAGLAGTEWKTVCTNPNETYVREVYKKQLEIYSIGRFRILGPDGKVIEEGQAKPLFSNN